MSIFQLIRMVCTSTFIVCVEMFDTETDVDMATYFEHATTARTF